tara:strand:+ start:16817 stop:17311 length:495 start_codon:yes stop_codon:yes gene_type:complete
MKDKKAKKDVKKQEKQVNDYINDVKRIQAEFENYVKRSNKEKEEFTKYASHNLLLKLLNMADDFDRAVHNMKSPKDSKEFSSGIELIHKNFHKVLDEENVKEIKSVGENFDPYLHEVIQKKKSDKDDNVILEEVQKGYTLHGKVLRSSKVIISEKDNSNLRGGK